METTYLQAFTRLPLELIARPSSSGTDVVVTTPHKGKVILASKQLHRAMFSAALSAVRKHLEEKV